MGPYEVLDLDEGKIMIKRRDDVNQIKIDRVNKAPTSTKEETNAGKSKLEAKNRNQFFQRYKWTTLARGRD